MQKASSSTTTCTLEAYAGFSWLLMQAATVLNQDSLTLKSLGDPQFLGPRGDTGRTLRDPGLTRCPQNTGVCKRGFL